jgi:hypothetical protein
MDHFPHALTMLTMDKNITFSSRFDVQIHSTTSLRRSALPRADESSSFAEAAASGTPKDSGSGVAPAPPAIHFSLANTGEHMPAALRTAMDTASTLMSLSMICCIMSCCSYCVASVIKAADEQHSLVVASQGGQLHVQSRQGAASTQGRYGRQVDDADAEGA